MLATVIVAPPPTPNGDLHVGHLSGPYFGADIYRRYLTMRQQPVVSALSVDLNQSYVVTTAQRLDLDPAELAKRSHAEVQETLEMANIHFDHVGMPDTAYTQAIRSWFASLYDTGLLIRRTQPYPFDVKQQRFMFESYASGRCPVCLSGTNGNICEACGHPNDAADLLGLYPTNGSAEDPIEYRGVVEYCLDLEEIRDELASYLKSHIAEKRPALRRLLSEMFERRLPVFPVTFPSDWGIAAPFPDADGLCLNVWAEMVPGHYHWIDVAARRQGHDGIVSDDASNPYVQYLGFDNSFFYVLAQLGLALVARKAGLPTLLPTAFITNEFYQLDNFKFSTSQGHLIWGRDLLAELPADEARFYFAWSNPEYNQTNFTRADLEVVLDKKLRKPLRQVLLMLAALSDGIDLPCVLSEALLARFEDAYRPDRQSLRIAALSVNNGLELLLEQAELGAPGAHLRAIAQAVAVGLNPISPNLALELWQAAGRSGRIAWPSQPPIADAAE